MTSIAVLTDGILGALTLRRNVFGDCTLESYSLIWEAMNSMMQGCKTVILFGLFCCLRAADNNIRIALDDGSARQGRIEVFYDGEWGSVCDDGFEMAEAKTACLQLGYNEATGYTTGLTGGPSTYLVGVDCQPNHASLHDCYRLPWKQHSCPSSGKVGVACKGGYRETCAALHQKAQFYWNCDNFASGAPYDIKSGHSAQIYGAATFVRTPIDSGFNLYGQSAWVKLGNFSDQPCLVDPKICSLYVSVWLKIGKHTSHDTYVLGNKYDGQNFYGFHIRVSGHRLRGEVRGSHKGCNFHDYNFVAKYWFHFSMYWHNDGKKFEIYYFGGRRGKKACWKTGSSTVHNHIYTLGADESLAGNSNRDFNVSYDELVIWYGRPSSHEVSASTNVAQDFDGYAVTNITLKLPGFPWNTTYSQTTSAEYLNLKQRINDLTTDIFNHPDIRFQSFSLHDLQNSLGDLEMTLSLNFSKLDSRNGQALFRSFYEGTFLSTTPEVKDCTSKYQSCTDIVLDAAFADNNPEYASAYFYPVAEHLADPYFGGYFIIAHTINGTSSDVYWGHSFPTTTARAHGNVKCGPYKLVAITVQLRTLKEAGFRCSNFLTVHTRQGSPSEGPSYVHVTSKSAFNVTVDWGEITSGQNGHIQKYEIRLKNKHRHTIATICCVLVNETRVASFYILHPGDKYFVEVCGFTIYHKCGKPRDTGWFHATALLPGKAPRSLLVTPLSRSAKFTWTVVHPSFQYGRQISYKIKAYNLRTEEIDFSFSYPVTDESRIDYVKWLSGLKGLTNYRLNVSLINQVGEGPIASLLFTTLEGVPSAHPHNINIVNITADAVSMTWEAIDFEETHGILLGYRMYYRLAGLNGTWSNVSVTNLTGDVPVLSLRSYEIRVCGYTRVGNGILSPIYIANSSGFAPTNVSTDIRIFNATNDTLSVDWSYNTPHNKPAQYFIITATRNDTNVTVVKETLDVMFWPSDVFWITLKGLQEFKWYIVRVAAGNLMGLGPYSDMLVFNHTLEGVPSAAPRNLTATNSSSRSIFLEWKPVLYEYADGIILGHKVFWRLIETSLSYASQPWETTYVNGTRNTSAEIKNLEKFKDYEFKILAFNSVGESVTTNIVNARTDEDIPLHPPLNVKAYNTSSRSLLVTWDPVPAEWRFGIIRGYQVIITDTRDGREYVYDVKVSENRSLEQAGFERYTNYTVRISAYTIKGLGNYSEPIRVITDEDVPSEAPPGLQCNYMNSTSLNIEWSVLPVVKAHGIVRTYVIFLERSDGRHVEIYNDTQPYTSLNTSFHGLDEYVEYSVQILGTTIKGDGPKSVPVTCLTDEDVPHATPLDLNGFNTSDTTMKIFWQEVPIDDRNGIITGYTIFFNTTLRSGENRHRTKRVGGNTLQAELINLFPYKYYDIQVAARTSKGMGPKCNVTTILTEEEAPKIPPSRVTAFNTSSTSIRLTWRPIPPEQVGGILRGYKIFWEEVNYLGEVILQNETRLDNASHEFLDFTGLTKFQEYRFSILAFTKFDGVLSPVVSTLTDEDIPTLPPSNCSGWNISKNEIQVSWDVIPRADRNGIILGYNIYTTEVFNYFATMPSDYVAPLKNEVINTTDEAARSFIQHNLVPYTDYSFHVNGFTSKGNGPNCTAFIVRTEEEAPLYSPGNISLRNTSSTSIKVTWYGLDEHVIRGIFYGYEIWFTAHPEFPSAYLRYGDEARRKRAAFTFDTQATTAEVADESIEITGLAKYTNYTIQVIGYTKFLGAQSEVVRIITDEDIPSKSPQDLGGRNLSSTSIYVNWQPVEDGFVHGILLGYRLYYRLTNLPLMPPFNKTFPPDQLATIIHGLFMFTNYTFEIAAFTSKGEGPLTEGVRICTDEDVASKSPFAFEAVNLYHMHEIPLSWQPVPEGFLNGILTGYRIKMRIISDAMVDVYGPEQHIDVDPDTLSYTVRKQLNFATYTFQIVAMTRYGEGVHSRVKVAKTCPCEKYLTTNWYMLPPYTNRTGDEETGIFPWLLNKLVKECCGDCSNGHGWSEIMYKTDGYGVDGFKDTIADFSSTIDENTDFSFPVQGHSLMETYRTFYSYVYSIASPGVAFFTVDDPPGKMPNAVLQTVNSSWGLMVIAVLFSSMAGALMWFLDAGQNETEFPRRFFRGSGEGFWWAFISMTTVGYGDRSPRSFAARVFSIFWVLAGLVLSSILMGSITNALTTVIFDTKTVKLYGLKIAAIDGSPSFRVGIRRNAKVNQDNSYHDAYELQRDLRERKVKGALLDGYMAGSYNELFEEDHIRVKEIIDYNTGYGFVLGGIHHRLQRCFKNYAKRKRSYIVDYVASQIHTVKKNPKSAAEAQSTNLFNPKSHLFVMSMACTLALFVAAIIAGICLQFHFKKRFRKKVRDETEATCKNIPKVTSEILETFSTRISLLKKELYYKHTNELRSMSGLKRREVEYDILKQIKEDESNPDVKKAHSSYTDGTHDNKFTSQTLLLKSPSTTSGSTTIVTSDRDDATPDDDEIDFRSLTLFTQDSVDESIQSESRLNCPAKQSHVHLELPTVEARPDIEDLQREAYLAGLKAEGKDESGHPFATMYRYLWVEKDMH